MPNISEFYSGEFLKCEDLKNQDAQVTIDKVEERDFENDRPKLVLSFRGKDKLLVLNKTNAKNIARFLGNATEDWPGNDIVLHPTKVDFKGDYVDAIRVHEPPRPAAPVDLKTELNDDIPF